MMRKALLASFVCKQNTTYANCFGLGASIVAAVLFVAILYEVSTERKKNKLELMHCLVRLFHEQSKLFV